MHKEKCHGFRWRHGNMSPEIRPRRVVARIPVEIFCPSAPFRGFVTPRGGGCAIPPILHFVDAVSKFLLRPQAPSIMRKLINCTILVILLSSPAHGQRRPEGPREAGRPVFYETHNFPASDPLKSRVDVLYRIPYDFFIFVKNRSLTASKPFSGISDIAIEILDSSKMSVARSLVERRLEADVSDPDSLKGKFLVGGTSASLAPGEYSLVVEVNDRESERHFLDKSRVIRLRDFSGEQLDFCDLILTDPSVRDTSAPIIPLNYNETVPFGAKVQVIAQLKLPLPAESLRVSVRIYKRLRGQPGRKPILGDSSMNTFVVTPGLLVPVFSDSGFSYRQTSSPGGHYDLLSAVLPTDSFQLGEYEMEFRLACGGVEKKASHRFQIRWLDMPRSLRDQDLAIALLRYIMSDTEYQKIRHARDDERDSLFERFWKQRDPTPLTAKNEVMAEYYKRADYAISHFGTLKNPNGAETDRGRIYMLYGPPTRVQNIMQPDAAPREIWDYAPLQKHFVFVDESRQGNFTLISSND